MNVEFTRLTEGFKQWLGIIGYSIDSIESLPRVVERYFMFMENQRNVKTLDGISTEDTFTWHEGEKKRKSSQTGELLKNSTLNGQIRALRLFSKYLDETSLGKLRVDLPYEEKEVLQRDILTEKEIRAMYAAAGETVLGLRDRAILSIYYGCGLRSKEGQFLQTKDIILDRKLVYVRKGKQYRERYVPIVQGQMKDFIVYLKECRPQLEKEHTQNWFLLNNYGRQVSSSFLHRRIRHLCEISAVDKQVGLHTLRHTIATHLLQSGMKLEGISQFLGHKNIQSTQRYTHVSAEQIFSK